MTAKVPAAMKAASRAIYAKKMAPPKPRKAPQGSATLSSTNPLVYMRTPATPCTKLKPLVKAPSLQICNANTKGYYSYTATLEAPRPGADDHLRCPSRTGQQLRHIGGHITNITG